MVYLVLQAQSHNRKEAELRGEIMALKDRIEGAKGEIDRKFEDLIYEFDETAEQIEERVAPSMNVAEMIEAQRGQIVNSLLEWGVQSVARKFGGGQVSLATIENVQEPSSSTD